MANILERFHEYQYNLAVINAQITALKSWQHKLSAEFVSRRATSLKHDLSFLESSIGLTIAIHCMGTNLKASDFEIKFDYAELNRLIAA